MSLKSFLPLFVFFIFFSDFASAQTKIPPASVINGSKSIEFLLGYRSAKANHFETSSDSSFFSLGREYSLPDYSLEVFHNFNILRFKRLAIEVQLGGGFAFSHKKIEDEGSNLKLRETSFSPKYSFGARLKLPYFSFYKNYFQPTLGLRNSTAMFKSDLTYSRFNNSNQNRIDYKYDLSETEIYGTLRLLDIFEGTYLDIGYATVSDSASNIETSSEVAGRTATITPLATKTRNSSKIFLGLGIMY
jgi:hypothetical protein